MLSEKTKKAMDDMLDDFEKERKRKIIRTIFNMLLQVVGLTLGFIWFDWKFLLVVWLLAVSQPKQ